MLINTARQAVKTAFRPPVRVLPLLLILAAAATGLIPCVRAQTPVRVLRSTDIAPGTGGQTYESYRFIGFDRAGSLWCRCSSKVCSQLTRGSHPPPTPGGVDGCRHVAQRAEVPVQA